MLRFGTWKLERRWYVTLNFNGVTSTPVFYDKKSAMATVKLHQRTGQWNAACHIQWSFLLHNGYRLKWRGQLHRKPVWGTNASVKRAIF